jgi:hypothetical protein
MDSQSNPNPNSFQPHPEPSQNPDPAAIPVAEPPQNQASEKPVIQMPQNPVTLPPALSEVAQKPLPLAESYFTPTMPSGPNPQVGAPAAPSAQLPDTANLFKSDTSQGAGKPIVLGNPPRRKKWVKPVAIIAVLLLLGSGSAAAYYGYYVPHQPKYILARALGNTISKDKIKSARYQGTYAIKSTDDKQTYKGSFSGYADGKVFAMQGTVGLLVTTVKVEARTFANNNAYVKLSGLDGLGDVLASSGYGSYSPYVTAVNNNWVELDQSLLSSASGAGTVGGVKLSSADAQKVQTIYQQHLFVQVTKVYGDDTINGMDSYHYKISVDHKELYAFATELNKARISGLPELNKETLSWIQKTDLSKYSVEVWIGKDQMVLNKMAITAPLGKTTVSSQLSLSDINSTATVAKPTKAKTLLEVLSEGLLQDPQSVENTIKKQASSLNVLTN